MVDLAPDLAMAILVELKAVRAAQDAILRAVEARSDTRAPAEAPTPLETAIFGVYGRRTFTSLDVLTKAAEIRAAADRAGRDPEGLPAELDRAGISTPIGFGRWAVRHLNRGPRGSAGTFWEVRPRALMNIPKLG